MASGQADSRILFSDLLYPVPAQSPQHPPATTAGQAPGPLRVSMDVSYSRMEGKVLVSLATTASGTW